MFRSKRALTEHTIKSNCTLVDYLISRTFGSRTFWMVQVKIKSSYQRSEWGKSVISGSLTTTWLLMPIGLVWVFQKLTISWDFPQKTDSGVYTEYCVDDLQAGAYWWWRKWPDWFELTGSLNYSNSNNQSVEHCWVEMYLRLDNLQVDNLQHQFWFLSAKNMTLRSSWVQNHPNWTGKMTGKRKYYFFLSLSPVQFEWA